MVRLALAAILVAAVLAVIVEGDVVRGSSADSPGPMVTELAVDRPFGPG